MLETKSLVTSIKNELLDQLLGSIDKEFSREAIVVPAELIPYMQGKEPETEEEGKRIGQMFNAWLTRALRLLGRTKDATQNLKIAQEILNSLPEAYRASVKKELRRQEAT